MAAKRFFRFLVLLLIAICGFTACQNYSVKKLESGSYRFDSSQEMATDPEVDEIIAPYQKELAVEMSEVIGYNQFEMAKQQPESPLGTFMCDAILSEAANYYDGKIDFAVINYGGMRIPFLSAGPIRVGRIFELMPFENYLVVLDLDLATTQRLFKQMADRGGWPLSNGVQMQIDKEEGTYKVQIDGAALGEQDSYKVLISDYIANGGDDCSFLKDANRETLDILLRDAIIENLRGHSDTISYQVNGNISYE